MAYAVSGQGLRLPALPVLGQLARYTLAGGLGTVINVVLYLALRTWWDTLSADLVALVLSTAIGTEVNRHFTFGAASGTHRWRAHAQTLGTIVFYALYSSAVLVLVEMLVDDPSPLLETITISVASVAGGVLRFAVLRYWVFGSAGDDGSAATGADRSHPRGDRVAAAA